jgi:hypothetical protein
MNYSDRNQHYNITVDYGTYSKDAKWSVGFSANTLENLGDPTTIAEYKGYETWVYDYYWGRYLIVFQLDKQTILQTLFIVK